MTKTTENDARHEFRFHHRGRFVVALAPFTEERVDLIYEDDAWLGLLR